jgi:hypothetical protein|tara:strand:+ start:440 stop:976 length:537 start_codon:yes stop_codon:yes gene_type:complete
MASTSDKTTDLVAGNIVALSAPFCLDIEGTHGVLVNAPSLKDNDHAELCVVFETGRYIYYSSEMPLASVAHDERFDCDAQAWQRLVAEIRENGIDGGLKYGFSVFECDGVLELQREDATALFPDDRSAARECARLSKEGNPFARACIQRLRQDADKRAGAGRNGAVHDYHLYELSTAF